MHVISIVSYLWLSVVFTFLRINLITVLSWTIHPSFQICNFVFTFRFIQLIYGFTPSSHYTGPVPYTIVFKKINSVNQKQGVDFGYKIKHELPYKQTFFRLLLIYDFCS